MKNIENIVVGYPFVSHVNQELEPTIENPKDFLKRAYVMFYTNNDTLLRFGYYKLRGYLYDFEPYLKNTYINSTAVGTKRMHLIKHF